MQAPPRAHASRWPTPRRLERTYRRMPDDGTRRFDDASPAFGFTCVLVFDETGLAVDYPGIAARVA